MSPNKSVLKELDSGTYKLSVAEELLMDIDDCSRLCVDEFRDVRGAVVCRQMREEYRRCAAAVLVNVRQA